MLIDFDSLPPANEVYEGYVFTRVCHSVHGGGGVRGCSGGHTWLLPGRGACMVATGGCAWLLLGGCVVAPGGHTWLLRGVHGYSWGACVVAPGGHTWLLRGVHGYSWGACVVAPGGHAWDTTRYGDTINERAVRILLECILVYLKFF